MSGVLYPPSLSRKRISIRPSGFSTAFWRLHEKRPCPVNTIWKRLISISSSKGRGIIKKWLKEGVPYEPLKGKTLGMIFDKSSTRTRLSFEVGMYQLGGMALFLSSRDTQIGRGEPIADTGKNHVSLLGRDYDTDIRPGHGGDLLRSMRRSP